MSITSATSASCRLREGLEAAAWPGPLHTSRMGFAYWKMTSASDITAEIAGRLVAGVAIAGVRARARMRSSSGDCRVDRRERGDDRAADELHRRVVVLAEEEALRGQHLHRMMPTAKTSTR